MKTICRTCIQPVNGSAVALEKEVKWKLMQCIPEMDLRVLPDTKLCEDCNCTIDVMYNFKLKYREVEKKIEAYLKKHGIVELAGLLQFPPVVIRNVTIKEEHNVDDAVCRTCLRHVVDGSLPALNDKSFYKHKLMLCAPEINFWAVPNTMLCKDCCTKLNMSYNFKLKCRDVEKTIHNYLTVNAIIDEDFMKWSNMVKKEQNYLEFKSNLTVKQEEIDLDDGSTIRNNNREPNSGKPSRRRKKIRYLFMKNKGLVQAMPCTCDDDALKCQKCMYKAYINSSLKQRKHRCKKIFICAQCKYCTADKSHLTRHLLIHTGEKPYKCSDCEYSSRQRAYLKRHYRIHTGEKPFKCTQCEYTATQKSYLKRHFFVHTGEKPFKCSQCKYSTVQKSQLKKHSYVHTNEKPFKCSQCDFSTKHKSYLKQHVKVHTCNEEFNCADCNYSATRKLLLKRHVLVHARKVDV